MPLDCSRRCPPARARQPRSWALAGGAFSERAGEPSGAPQPLASAGTRWASPQSPSLTAAEAALEMALVHLSGAVPAQRLRAPWLRRSACTLWLPRFLTERLLPLTWHLVGARAAPSAGCCCGCQRRAAGPARALGSPGCVQRGAALPVLRSPCRWAMCSVGTRQQRQRERFLSSPDRPQEEDKPSNILPCSPFSTANSPVHLGFPPSLRSGPGTRGWLRHRRPFCNKQGKVGWGQKDWLGTVSPGVPRVLPRLVTLPGFPCPALRLRMVPQQEKPLVEILPCVPLLRRDPEALGHAPGGLGAAGTAQPPFEKADAVIPSWSSEANAN